MSRDAKAGLDGEVEIGSAWRNSMARFEQSGGKVGEE